MSESEPGTMRPFLVLQIQRLKLRWTIVQPGLTSALFWTLAILGAEWAHHYGWDSVAALLFGLWVGLSVPVIYIQLHLILDLVGYGLTGRTYFYPLLLKYADAKSPAEATQAIRGLLPAPFNSAPQPPETPSPGIDRFARFVAVTTGNTSPLSCLATWALVVLMRMPATAHTTAQTVRAVRVREMAERTCVETAISRLSHHHAVSS